MKTLEHSQQTLFPQTELPEFMSSPGGSRAKTLALPESRQEWEREHDPVSGPKSFALLASYDRDTSSWRTSQTCLVALLSNEADGLAVFSETWPSAGMMRSGKTYQLEPWALPIVESASGLLPTPRKNDSQKRGNFDLSNPRNGFPAAVKRLFLPTLGKNEPKGCSTARYLGSERFKGSKMSEGLRTCATDPIYLHPSFAEAVMGFPIGWTELEPAETP